MKTLALILVGSVVVGCGAPAEEPPAPEVFIALPRDFLHFDQWTRYELPPNAVAGSPHIAGARTVFLNKIPAKGSKLFPVGTIIVKRVADGSQSFAMVKRGGDYNQLGATNWEWFELRPATDGTPVIVWRGITPPSGEVYHGVSGGECNTCHASGSANDFVQSEPLRLSGF